MLGRGTAFVRPTQRPAGIEADLLPELPERESLSQKMPE
jgi:hypothetical protein